MVLTADERVKAIAEFGFTERQARFLETVMRHAGVCIPRQYAQFASIANGGEKCNSFFAELVRRQYAIACDCLHNRARIYHVRHKRLYHAICEAESRYRRPVPAGQAVERLMLLDAVLASGNLTWLTTELEKVRYVATLTKPTDDAPEAGHADALSNPLPPAFVRQFPVGLHASGRVVLLYLVTVPWTDDFRVFIQTHAMFLRAVPAWTLRLVFARPLDRAYDAYQLVVHEELEAPLHRYTISELKSYFEHRRKATAGRRHPLTQALLNRGAEVFGSARFMLLYRRWLKHGDVVFETASSTVFAAALANGTGRVESLILPHTYRHLSPVATLVQASTKGVEKGEQRGEQSTARPQPPSSTPPPESLTVAEQLERDWYWLIGRS
jgi:hypothetical protein